MSDKGQRSASGGIGFTGLLTVAFVVLKLTHVIDWSWWLVLSPILFLPALVVAAALVIGLIAIGQNAAGKIRAAKDKGE